MTEIEIREKITQYQTSDAPVEVIQAAIEKLEARIPGNLDVVRKQIEEGASDIDSADHLS